MANETNTITIVDATPNDLSTINEILRLSKSYWGYDEAFLDRFMQKLSISHIYLQENPTKLFFINNDLIGFYSFVFNEDGTLELDNFFLHPKYIGQGLGSSLWKACLNTAKELGRNEFIIWSDPNAEDFYLKMGCEKIGVRKSPMLPNRYPAVFKYKIR